MDTLRKFVVDYLNTSAVADAVDLTGINAFLVDYHPIIRVNGLTDATFVTKLI